MDGNDDSGAAAEPSDHRKAGKPRPPAPTTPTASLSSPRWCVPARLVRQATAAAATLAAVPGEVAKELGSALGAAPRPGDAARAVRSACGAGLLRPVRPDVALRSAAALWRDGLTPAAAYAIGALRFPDRVALVDDTGALTFAELAASTEALAVGLQSRGVKSQDRVGLLARNHRGFVEAMGALAVVGADIVFLNTSFAGPQLAGVVRDYGLTGVLYDADFLFAVEVATAGQPCVEVLTWGSDPAGRYPTLAEVAGDMGVPGDESIPDPLGVPEPVAGGGRRRPPLRVAPRRTASRYVLLTSGTTGTPRAAPRRVPSDPIAAIALLSQVPVRAQDVTLVAAPLFHAWGLANLGIGMALAQTVVLQHHFDAVALLAAVERHAVRTLVAVPVMLQRVLELEPAIRARYDTSCLQLVLVSGSALPGDLAARWMDAFGDTLYSVYGSTEAAWGAIASPADLRRAPGTAGHPPPGTRIEIVDRDGRPLPPGVTGRIAVGNRMLTVADGGRGGGDRAKRRDLERGAGRIRGCLPTGDIGHVDQRGLLFVEGREDDMIVSGGENVYPFEVEEALAAHPGVLEAAVIGVPDPEFGQRLRALVVRRSGTRRVTAEELRRHVRDQLASYKVPRDVEFVDALERNATGKVLHRRPGRSN